MSDIVLFCSWQVNGRVTKATQTNLDSELHLKAVEDAVVNCTADNSFGAGSKTAEITVHGKKFVTSVVFFFSFYHSKPLLIFTDLFQRLNSIMML